MTIHAAYQELIHKLFAIYDDGEAANIANCVLEYITSQTKIERIINKNTLLNDVQLASLQTITNKLLQHIPVQYALNEAWFGGMKFYVDSAVLIPRPETDELVDWVVKDTEKAYKSSNKIEILDIGSGSGCIPITLNKRLPKANITSIDVSEMALKVAKKNAIALDATIALYKMDFLNEASWGSLGVYDIIVSNPPYIKDAEKQGIDKNVTENEPSIALFVANENPLVFYKKMAGFAKSHLTKEGIIYVEINETLGNETIAMFNENGYATQLKKDLQDRDRMIKAWKTG